MSVFHQTGYINNTTNQQGQLDIHTIVHPTTAEFLFKHPRDIHKDIYILGHKTNLNKTVWSFLKELKTESPYDPAIPPRSMYPDKIINLKRLHAPLCS